MDTEKLMDFIDSLEKTGWNKLELAEGDFSVKLERELGCEVVSKPKPRAMREQVVELQEEKPVAEQSAAIPEGKDVLSPLVGIYHALETPVKAGDSLKKGQTICLVEAMKLMNEISMPEDGEITYIAASEGDSVEFGQILYKYK